MQLRAPHRVPGAVLTRPARQMRRSGRTIRDDLNEIDGVLMRPMNAPPRIRKRRKS